MWKYNISSNAWEFLCGNKTINVDVNYDAPYPGGIYQHTMCMDNARRLIYIFGGRGAGIG